MVARLFVGLLKGLLIGAAIGAALHFGLQVTVLTGVLGYLLAAFAAAVAGVLAGQPPWRQGAWVGSILKGVFGLAVGAGLYALLTHVLKVPLPAVAGITAGAEIAQTPLVFAPAVAAVYAGLIELDDGGAPEEQSSDASKAGVRVNAALEDVEDEEVPVSRNERARGRAKG